MADHDDDVDESGVIGDAGYGGTGGHVASHVEQLVRAIREIWNAIDRFGGGSLVMDKVNAAVSLADEMAATYCINPTPAPPPLPPSLIFHKSDTRPGLYAVEVGDPAARKWLESEGFIAPNVFMLKETVHRVSERARKAGFKVERRDG